MANYAIILAAGKGTRMRTKLPKGAFPILRKPMIEYIVESVEQSPIDSTVAVVGHGHETIERILSNRVQYALQSEQLGTGHAAMQARALLEGKAGTTLILLGDMPLIDASTIESILHAHQSLNNDLTVVSASFDDPHGYGRIVRDDYGNIQKIVEEASATQKQRRIKEVNTGLYAVDNALLFDMLDKIEKDPYKGEYYLTDIVEVMRDTHKVGIHTLRENNRLMGVNDLYAVSQAEKILRDEINKHHMLEGVSMINPETITIGHSVKIEPNVTIYPNTTITGDSRIDEAAVIGPNSEIHNGTIKSGVHVRHSLIHDSIVHERTTIGPFAHLRNRSEIGRDNRIGNFVEIKKSSTGINTKASHLAYIGDATTGANVNFGSGSVTVNYDGIHKHQTHIGDDVFIGCNTNLIAPISIGDNVFIAAGSTVTQNVPSNAMAIARQRQINKEDYARNLIKPKKKNGVENS